MNISSETGMLSVTEISRNPSNDGESCFHSLKSAATRICSVSLAVWIIILVIAIIGVIPLTQLIVGIIHKDDCPMNYLIPIYLIVAGVIGLTMVIISAIQSILSDKIIWLCLKIVIGAFKLGWLIAGCVWVFGAKSTVQFDVPSAKSTYCNRVAFNCAFVTLILGIIGLFCMFCSQVCRKKS